MNFGLDTAAQTFWQEAVWREERCRATTTIGDSWYARGQPHGKNNISMGVNDCMEAAAIATTIDLATEQAVPLGPRSRCSTPFMFRASSPTPPSCTSIPAIGNVTSLEVEQLRQELSRASRDMRKFSKESSSPVQQVAFPAAGYFTGLDEHRQRGKSGCGNTKASSKEVECCLNPPPKTKAFPRQSPRSPSQAMYEQASVKKAKGIKYALCGAWASARALAKRTQPHKKKADKTMAYAEFADIGVATGPGPKVGRRMSPGGAPRSAWSGRSMNRTGIDDGCFGPQLMLSNTR